MLYVVRHGQVAANVGGHLLGRADPPLTAVGRAQAEALAAAVPVPDVVIASPLVRATHTASAFGVEVRVDARWIELDYGTFDGCRPAEVPAETRRRWRTDSAFAPPGGESLDQLAARVRQACDELVAIAADGVVVVVTHVSPIKAAIAWALQVGDLVAWRMWVDEASISRIDCDGPHPTLRWFNHQPPTACATR